MYKYKPSPTKQKRTKLIMLSASVLILITISFLASRMSYLNAVLQDFVANTTLLDGAYVKDSDLYFFKGCDAIKMGITDDQAFSIQQALSKAVFSRPLTHDLFFDVMSFYDIKTLHAKLDSLEDGIYKAKILFYKENKIYEIDSRPSDMAALSLRYGNKMSINNNMLWNFTKIC